MIITEPGEVTDRITLLGRPESCVSLIDGGSEFALFGGSMSYVVPEILEQIEALGIDEEKIRHLVVLHAHFDHCGAIPALKRRWPWATVTASSRAGELLAKPKVSQSIAMMNQAAAARFDRTAVVVESELEYTQIDVEQALGDGDVLSVGDLSHEVLAVPGHSSCSIALWAPESRTLFPSDAAGIAVGDFFFSAGNSNIDDYLQSLERLVALDVQVLLREHYGGQTAQDARASLDKALEDGRKTRELLEETYRRVGDAHKCTAEVLDQLADGAPPEFLPREVLGMVVGQMVKYIARKLETS